MKIILRKEAKSKGLKHYYTGIPCKYGHLTKRLVSSTSCCECTRLRHYTDYAKHRDKRLKNISEWQKNNKDKVNHSTQRWRQNNPESSVQTHKKYYDNNKETKLAYGKQWRQDNHDKVLYYNVDRRTKKLQANVKWADNDKIRAIYKKAVQLTEDTGIPHHVDHIIPLTHDSACGLHCEDNLQILTMTENLSKGNKF